MLCCFHILCSINVEEGVRQCSQLPKGILVLCHGGMSFLSVKKKGLSIKLKRCSALLFWSMKPNATLDLRILIALLFITVGIGFKLSPVPSHQWTLDIYERVWFVR